jgi:hypothetical protein
MGRIFDRDRPLHYRFEGRDLDIEPCPWNFR